MQDTAMELNIVEDVRYIFFMMARFALVVIFTSDPNQSDHESKVEYDNYDCVILEDHTNLNRTGKRF